MTPNPHVDERHDEPDRDERLGGEREVRIGPRPRVCRREGTGRAGPPRRRLPSPYAQSALRKCILYLSLLNWETLISSVLDFLTRCRLVDSKRLRAQSVQRMPRGPEGLHR